MIKITMVSDAGVWDAEDSAGTMSICDAVNLEPKEDVRTSDKNFADAAEDVFIRVSKTSEVHHVVLTLEDLIVCAIRSSDENFQLLAADRFSGKVVHAHATREKLAAILYLALAGDDGDRTRELYPLAESVVAAWPSACRPIP